ncbi:MAG: DUF4416 family protein, partial [Fibrobacteres bacterium]|nr:DUF4416 family protein [Fibrobacterota bacterium]
MKEPVKVFAAILYRDEPALSEAISQLSGLWGDADSVSKPQPFDVTDYYSGEMGADLKRILVSFRRLQDASRLGDIKRESIIIEERLKKLGAGRTVNIDSGYIDVDKVVLASTKRGPYKIYLNEGMWADMILHYEKGHFTPFKWSFADFKDGRYEKDLLHIRELYKKGKSQL